MRIGIMPGQWGWRYHDLKDAWRAAENSGFDLVGCFDHVSSAPRGVTAWDAPSLLTAMSANTERITLALWCVNAALRNPLLVAGQIAVAQAESGGRVEVGLGAGSLYLARYDHEVAGIAFPSYADRLAILEATCKVLPALWRGEQVTDERLGLRNACLGDLEIAVPPLLVGGSSDEAMRIALRYAQGWNGDEGDPDQFGELARRCDVLAESLVRERPVVKSAQLFVKDADLTELRDRVARLRDAGAQDVMLLLDQELEAARWVEKVAAAVLPTT